MRLTRITAKNFKGQTFDLTLSPLTMLVGANFTGKTARTDLIRWTLLGYLPELGKTNRASFGLASGREMIGTAEFDDGTTIRRRLFLKGDAVKEEVTCPDNIAGSSLIGPMLNAESYFALSDRERVAYAFANCPQEGDALTPDSIEARLIKDLQPSLNQASAGAQLIGFIKRIRAMSSAPAEYLEAAVESATLEAKSAREYATRMEKTTQGLAALKAQDTSAPAAAAEDPEAIARQLSEINQQIAENRRQADEARRTRDRRADLENETADLDLLREQLAAMQASTPSPLLATQLDKDRYTLTARIATLEAVLAGRTANQARIAELTKQTANLPMLQETLRVLQEQLDAPVPAAPDPGSTQMQLAAAKLEGELAAARLKIDEMKVAWAKTQRAINDVDVMQTCPFCGATGTGWKTMKLAELVRERDEIVARGREHREDEQTILSALSLKNAAITQAKAWEARGEAARLAHARLESQAASVKVQLSGLEAKAEELARIQTNQAGAVDVDTIHALRAKKDALTDQIADIRTAEGQISTLKAHVASMAAQQAELDRLPSVEPVDTILARNADLEAKQVVFGVRLEKVRTTMRAAAARQADLQRLAQAEQQRDSAKAEQEFAGKLADTLRTIQAESVERAFKPMLEIANRFAEGVIKTPLAYHAGEIGTWRTGVWVTHKTMSGVEKLVTYAAIQAALASKAPVRLMILDEMLRAQGEPFGRLITAVADAVKSGMVDSFIGIVPGRVADWQHLTSAGFQVTEIA